MGIPKEYTIKTCKMGQGNNCCRYLTCGPDGFCCEKHGSLKDLLDQRAKDKTMTAQSDNCEGWNIREPIMEVPIENQKVEG